MGKIADLIKKHTFLKTVGGPEYDMDGYETCLFGINTAEAEIKKWLLTQPYSSDKVLNYAITREITRRLENK